MNKKSELGNGCTPEVDCRKNDPADLMIILSTRQQIINWLVYLHFQPKHVIALSSIYAKKNGWCLGFEYMLGESFSEIVYKEQQETCGYAQEFFRLLEKRIKSQLSQQQTKEKYRKLKNQKGYNHNENSNDLGGEGENKRKNRQRIIWAWGGAQKPHSAALRDVAQKYISTDSENIHVLAYAEGLSGKLMCDGEGMVRWQKNPNRPAVDEILKVHKLCPCYKDVKDEDIASRTELLSFFEDMKVREKIWETPSYVKSIEELVVSEKFSFKGIQKIITKHINIENFFDELIEVLSASGKSVAKKPRIGAANKNTEAEASKDLAGNLSVLLSKPITRQVFFKALKKMEVVRIKRNQDENYCENQENVCEKKSLRGTTCLAADELSETSFENVRKQINRKKEKKAKEANRENKNNRAKRANRGFISSGEAFERLARSCVLDWYERYKRRTGKNNKITDIRFSVEVKPVEKIGDFSQKNNKNNVLAEFDCLIATTEGRLLSLDFKSAGRSKAWREQVFSIQTAGGRYAELFYLYPWIEEDLPPKDGEEDNRSKNVERRMNSIVSMDDMLSRNPFAGGRKTGVRMYAQPRLFDKEIESTLRL